MHIKNAVFVSLLIIVSGCKPCARPPCAMPPETGPQAKEVAAPELKPLLNDGSWMVTASTQEGDMGPGAATDGSMTTRWSSQFADGQWWQVDFSRRQLLGKIVIHWEDACARRYKVQVSEDGATWTEVMSEARGDGGKDIIVFEPRPVRLVRLELDQRATEWGFSFFEVEFNSLDAVQTEASASSGTGDYAPKFAIDGDTKTRWSSDFSDDQWWQIRFAEPCVIAGVKILWETAFSEKYRIETSMDGQTWQVAYDVAEGDGRTDILFFKPVQLQYLRIHGLQRGTGWGNSIWEVSFFDAAHAPEAAVSSAAGNAGADGAIDGDRATAWRSGMDGEQSLTLKLPDTMSLGGVELGWGDDYASAYDIECSNDGREWAAVFSEKAGNGGNDYNYFQAREVRWVRIVCRKSNAGRGYALAHLELKGGDEQATPIRFYQAKARGAKAGWYPMWLTRQQEFWTITGLPDDEHETALGETGTIEPQKGAFSVQPFVIANGQLVTYADVKLEPSLEDGVLPMPSVRWTADTWDLAIAPVTAGMPGRSYTAVRYRFSNRGTEPFTGRLALAVRPVTLNPLWQYGGMSAINEAECVLQDRPAQLKVGGVTRALFLTPPAAMGAAALGEGDIVDFLAKGEVPASPKAADAEGKVSVGVLYDLQVPAGASTDIIVAYPLFGESKIAADLMAGPGPAYEKRRAEQRAAWQKALESPAISIPEPRLIQFMKSNVGYVLLNRDPPWFKPGSRNYNHGWMRDGALTGVAMLRMGKPELAERFIRSFSEFIPDDGRVPYMIFEDGRPMGRPADPNTGEGQEYDSQGEYIFIVRQYYDFTRDLALLREVYPSVVRALRYTQEIRRKRMTDEYENNPEKQAYYGILPESNSHEGYYPAKHSYWDDFWALKGFKDGVYLAGVLGEKADAEWMSAEEQGFRKCLYDSMLKVIARSGLNNLPGCVELGDTDPTSTSVAIMACDEGDSLPKPFGLNTFDVYWQNFTPRLKPGGEQTFTPYESRNADVFVRIGQRGRALTVLRYFTSQSSRPPAWNHLAEVVHAKPRAPSYIGDMPHTWCGSDYINAVRSLFAFERGDVLVLAAGTDPQWLTQGGVTVRDLPTQFGSVSYAFTEDGPGLSFKAEGTAAPPKGFEVPLPDEFKSLSVEIDGQPAAATDGVLRFAKLPVAVRLFMPAQP